MGFNTKSNLQFVHVVLMTPEGRLVVIRELYCRTMQKWSATVSRPMVMKNFDNEGGTAVKAATTGVFTKFAFRPTEDDLSQVTCHYASTLEKIMHLYICKIPSGRRLECSMHTRIRILTLERICNELLSDPQDFTPETEKAINLISGLKTASGAAV